MMEIIVRNSDSMKYKEVTIKYEQIAVSLGLMNQEEANGLAQTFIQAADDLLKNIEIFPGTKEQLDDLYNFIK